MTLSSGFISDVQETFPDVPSLNKLLWDGQIRAVHAFLMIEYKGIEITPSVLLSLIDSPEGIKILKQRAVKAEQIRKLFFEAKDLLKKEGS